MLNNSGYGEHTNLGQYWLVKACGVANWIMAIKLKMTNNVFIMSC